MRIDDIARLAEALPDVRRTSVDERAQWRYPARLIAREIDDAHLVIRAEFDTRDLMLQQSAETFSVPTRYRKHMMVVADLHEGDAGAIEDTLEAAWRLQRNSD